MYVCMKTNLELNLELIKFWSRMDNFEVLFKKNNNFGKILF